ncbi:MAG: Brp/Blh family beta-carotene 15,15'-dioxygenase [Halolamina sp.]
MSDADPGPGPAAGVSPSRPAPVAATDAEATVRAALARWTLPLGWVAMALVTVAAVAGVLPAGRWRYVPLVGSALAFGLPHGAVDHLAPAWANDDSADARTLAGVGVLYAVLGGAYAVAWFLAPAASFVGFLLLTWLHWGQGDSYAVVTFGPEPTHLRSTATRATALVVRGGLPMVVPLVAFPEVYREVATLVVGAFGPAAAEGVAVLFRTDVRLALGGGLLAVTLVHLGGTAERSRAWALDAAEVVGLWVAFALTPPIVAVGAYFTAWHAPRHVARLLLIDDGARPALQAGDLTAALTRFARVAAPMTAGGVVVMAGLWVSLPRLPGGFAGVVAVYLVGLAALTLPHTVVVAAMDRAEGLWRAGG